MLAERSAGPLGADISDGRRWRGVAGVQVSQDEYGPPEEDEAQDLVRAHRNPEEDPVQDNSRGWEGDLRNRRVGSLGGGEAPVVEEETEEAGHQGQQDDPRRLDGKAGAHISERALHQHDGPEDGEGEEEPRSRESVEWNVLQDEPPQHGRRTPEYRGSQSESRRQSLGAPEGLERPDEAVEGDQVRPQHRNREARPVDPAQALLQQDVGQGDG